MNNNLGHSELTNLLDIIHTLTSIKDVDHFKIVAHSLTELMECDNIIFGLPQNTSAKEHPVNDLNINYPQEWVDIYQKKEFWRIDPIVQTAMEKNTTPQHWNDIYRRFPPDRKFLRLAHDFGIKNGCTCFTQGTTNHSWTIISIVGNFEDKHRVLYILERLAPHFHIALASLRNITESKGIQNLTKRECEVLKWLSQGKTSWETAIILKVAEATINFHVKNIKAKLDVSSRSHAVAIAIHGGLAL